MSYCHLTTFERGKIESYHKLDWSTREIGRVLNRHHSTIARELERNQANEMYDAQKGQVLYTQRRKASKPHGKWSEELEERLINRLEMTWSPEQIAGREGLVSFKTIYRWIDSGKILKGDRSLLRQKGKRQRPYEKRGRFTVGTPISKRPKDVQSRETVGHWELDTMVSSRGKSKGCLATFAERKTRFYLARKIPNRTADSMEQAIKEVVKEYPKDVFKSSTTDRGKEFSCYKKIEKDLQIDVYFADPYSSWQRGTNENSNGLLREFFPKKTDLAAISEDELQRAIDLINHRPRKILGWKTPHEAFWEEVSQLD